MRAQLTALTLLALAAPAVAQSPQDDRPAYLISQMDDGPLKSKLAACAGQPIRQTNFSIAHRGAPLHYPEHSREGYLAAANMAAGIVECDVTFTADLQLVCRHAQDDLHSTTNILDTPLAEKCSSSDDCRTSDLTLDEFLALKATKADAAPGTLMTHADTLALFPSLGVKFTPELKAPKVQMPYKGMTQEAYAQKLIEAYKEAGIPPQQVWPQSFNLADILYWIEAEPTFGAQAVYLDGSFSLPGWSPMDATSWTHSMAELKAMGVNIIAPPLWVLATLEDGKIVPSLYAKEATAAGLQIITWTLERSGPLSSGGGWYYQSITDAITHDGATYQLLDMLAQEIGVTGVFSDWPATTSYYASCMGLP